MQKALSLSLSLGLALSLAACDKKNQATTTPDTAAPEAAPAATEPAQEQEEAPAEQAAGGGFAPENDPTKLPMLACSGSEPDWSFELTPGGKLSWAPMGGEQAQLDVTSVRGSEENTWNVTLSSPTVLKSVVVSKEACSDTMSDTKFTYKAVLTNAQGATLKGCCNPMQ